MRPSDRKGAGLENMKFKMNTNRLKDTGLHSQADSNQTT